MSYWSGGDEFDAHDYTSTSDDSDDSDDGGLSTTDDSDDSVGSEYYNDPRTSDEHTYVPDEQEPGSDDWDSDDGGLTTGDSDDSTTSDPADYDDPRTDEEHVYMPDEQTPDDWAFNPNSDDTVTDVHGNVGEEDAVMTEDEFWQGWEEQQNPVENATNEAQAEAEQTAQELRDLMQQLTQGNAQPDVSGLSTTTKITLALGAIGAGYVYMER